MSNFFTRLIANIRRVLPLPSQRTGALAGSTPHASAAAAGSLGADLLGGGTGNNQNHSQSHRETARPGRAGSLGRASMIDEGRPAANGDAIDLDADVEVTTVKRAPVAATDPASAGSMVPSVKAYTQMAGLIERIGNHLDAQAERSDRMIALLERLPEALDSLSAIRGDSQTLIHVVREHLEGQVGRDEQLRSVLGDLSTNSGRQANVLELINQQLNQNQRTEAELVTTLADFRETLKDMSATNARSIAVLTELAQFGQRQQAEFTMILQKNNRMMMILSAVSVCVSAGGLIIALVALLRVLGAT